jgi:integrase
MPRSPSNLQRTASAAASTCPPWLDGVRTMRSLETGNRRHAETLEQRLREELHTRRFQLPQLKPEMPFVELFARFLSEGEAKAYHKERAKQFLSFFAEMPIGRITKNDIARYRKYRQEEHQRNFTRKEFKPLPETILNRDVEVIRHLLFWAADEGFLQANPIIRMARERGQRIADEEKLLAACAEHLRPIVIAALDTGMRRGELFHQLWEHIDFDRRLLSVTHSKNAAGEHRPIPFTKRVYAMLSEMLSVNHQSSGRIFTLITHTVRNAMTKLLLAVAATMLIPHLRAEGADHLSLVIAIDLTKSVATIGPDGPTDFQKNIDGVTCLGPGTARAHHRHQNHRQPGNLVCHSMESWWRRRFNAKRRRLRNAYGL